MKLITRLMMTALAGLALSMALKVGAAQSTMEQLKQQLHNRLETEVKSITKAPFPGWYEVNLGTQLVYTDQKGRYLLVGDLLDLNTRENLTAARLAELNRIDFSRLPLAQAVKVVKGNGGDAKRKIAVFSDPNCPYCKQLEKNLANLHDVTIYTFLYSILSPDSMTKAQAIWCAPERSQAWLAWATQNQAPKMTQCDTRVITQNLELGRSLNITGTPTVFFANGRRLSGALPVEKLEKEMSSAK